MSKTLSIVIPAYNEEVTIGIVIERVLNVVLPEGIIKEIIIVNDGSTDKTLQVIKSAANHPHIRVFSQENTGKAGALKRGMKEAIGDIILIQDADLEYDPSQYPLLLQPILDRKTEVVYGSRFLGKIDQMKPVNRAANLISNWTMSLLWGTRITDINTCFKVFTREAISGIDIKSSHFAFETEMTIKLIKKGLTILEVPIDYQARTREQGKKIKWSTALQMYWPIIKFRLFGVN